MAWIAALLIVWLLFNLLAPYAVVAMSRRMHVGNLPGEVLYRANANNVRFYRCNLVGGYAFTAWTWPNQIVVMDDSFLANAPPAVIRFVLAHELGHCVLGHTFRKWLGAVTGLAIIPAFRRWINKNEDKADEFAEMLTGVPRAVLRGSK